jgi:hypothetical protein
MARQQGHLTRQDASSGPASTGRLLGHDGIRFLCFKIAALSQPVMHVIVGATQIEIDHLSRSVVECQKHAAWRARCAACTARATSASAPARKAAIALERRTRRHRKIRHSTSSKLAIIFTRVKCAMQYYPGKKDEHLR